jgi:hypothetical protein
VANKQTETAPERRTYYDSGPFAGTFYRVALLAPEDGTPADVATLEVHWPGGLDGDRRNRARVPLTPEMAEELAAALKQFRFDLFGA